MTAITERSASIGGVRTRTLHVEGAGPPVLLVHGYTDSADTWRPMLAELRRAGRAAVAVDLPGYGAASAPPRSADVLGALEAFVGAAALELGDGRAVTLVGNSLGGLLTLRAACRAEAPVDRVVALAPAGYAHHPAFAVLEHAGHVLAPAVRAPGVRGLATRATTVVMARVAPLDADARARYAAHLSDGALAGMVAAGRPALRALRGAAPLDPRDVPVPVTFVWGGRDIVCPPAGIRRLARDRDDVDLLVLPYARHCPQGDHAGVIARVVLAAAGAPSLPEGAAA